MLEQKYSVSMRVQALYAAMCIVWNGVVIWQVQQGVEAIGPTGSLTVIMGAVVLVALLAFALRAGLEKTYLLLGFVVSALALSAVWSSISSSAMAWPSPFWQALGLLVNAIGSISIAIAVTIFIKRNTPIS